MTYIIYKTIAEFDNKEMAEEYMKDKNNEEYTLIEA